MRRYLPQLPLSLVFTASLLAIYFVFAPGISGPFLLDDHVHFPKLSGNDGNIDSVNEVLSLVTSGSSATGRPLSFLSLLIEDNGWPAKPNDYKQNNIFFHLINFCLVFLLTIKLLALTSLHKRNTSRYLALLVAVSWAVLPIHGSAIFLTIQRMTLLSTSMMLISIILVVSVWEKDRDNRINFSLYVLAGFFCIVGVMFKEIAILTVFYVYAAAYLARSFGTHVYLYKLIKYACVIIALGCVIYFFKDYEKMQSLYEKRDFTMAERILTEGRVLIEYMRQTLFPSMSGLGPFHDGYSISRSLFNPFTTFFSWVTIGILFGLSFFFRKQAPLFLFAVMWFFLGHSLESTFLPLEIYFEHRNYLPSYGLLLFAIVLFFKVSGAKLFTVIFLLYLALISFVSYAGSNVWGSRESLYYVWLSENPSSIRARIEVVKNELSRGRPTSAEQVFEDGLARHHDHAGYYLFGYIIGRCLTPNYEFYNVTKDDLYDAIGRSGFDHASLEGISWLVKSWEKWSCSIDASDIADIAKHYLKSDKFYSVKDARLTIENNLSKLAVQQGDLNAAVSYLQSNYEVSGDPTFLMNAAYLLASGGLFKESKEFIRVVDDKISKEINPLNKMKYQRIRDNTLKLVSEMSSDTEEAEKK